MPSASTLTVTPPGALEELGGQLAQYREVTGKTSAAVLLQKGAQLIFGNQNPKFGAVFRGLYQLFDLQSSRDGAITRAAVARGFRLGRRNFGSSLPGISQTALDRALAKMGGFRSILANISIDSDSGRIRVRGVRVGVSGRRIRGGRKGTGGRAIPGVVSSARQAGDVRLNLRAVATVEEINLRESGRRFLAVGWLFKRWRRVALEGVVPANTPGFRAGLNKSYQFGGVSRVAESLNPRSRLSLLGDAALTGDEAAGNVTLRLTSYVPGALAVGNARSLYAKAIAGMSADLAVYLARKNREALLAAVGAPAA